MHRSRHFRAPVSILPNRPHKNNKIPNPILLYCSAGELIKKIPLQNSNVIKITPRQANGLSKIHSPNRALHNTNIPIYIKRLGLFSLCAKINGNFILRTKFFRY